VWYSCLGALTTVSIALEYDITCNSAEKRIILNTVV
jgi:hypothetical protein